MEANNNNDNNIIKGKALSESRNDACVSNGFPIGLRVLVVDDDRTCLLILEKMLQTCLYRVTKCRQAKDALSMLREDKNRFDIIVIDLHMPDMDGFKLLQIAEFEMDLPVVMMSSDDDHEVILKGILHGACDYLIKPIRMDALKIIWQHVIRKKKKTAKEVEQLRSLENGKLLLTKSESDDDVVPANKGNPKSLKRRRNDEDDGDASDPAATAKKRMIWTPDLHDKFIKAVLLLGRENAVPLKILECMRKMNVHGLSREHVASHLQKYRRKQDDSPLPQQEHFMPSRVNRSFTFQQSQLLNGSNFQFGATTSQFALPNFTAPQAREPAPLRAISNIDLPLDGQRKFLHCRMLESNYSSISNLSANDFPINDSFGVGPACKNVSSFGVPSIGEENEYGNQGNVADNCPSLSVADPFDDPYESKDDNTPQLICDPSLYLQYFDQNEMLQGPSIEQGIPPILIKCNSASQSDE